MTELPESVREHTDECKAILSWLKADEWLSAEQLTRKCAEFRADPTRWQNQSAYKESKSLELFFDTTLATLDELVVAGVVENKAEGGMMHYRLRQQPVANPSR